MFRTASRTDRLTAGAANLATATGERLDDLRRRAGDSAAAVSDRTGTLSERAAELTERAAELTERATELTSRAAERAAQRTAEFSERTRPRVEAAQSTLRETVVPKVAAALSSAATTLSEASEAAREGAGPRVERARTGARIGNERARDAMKVLKGEATAVERNRSSKRKWLLGIGILAAVIAAVAAFRNRQQADDPWATPLTDPSPSSSFSERTADRVEQAKGAVGEAASRVKGKAAELAEKGQAAVADARDRTGELAEPGIASTGASGSPVDLDATSAGDTLDPTSDLSTTGELEDPERRGTDAAPH